jgi:hypothetical protein
MNDVIASWRRVEEPARSTLASCNFGSSRPEPLFGACANGTAQDAGLEASGCLARALPVALQDARAALCQELSTDAAKAALQHVLSLEMAFTGRTRINAAPKNRGFAHAYCNRCSEMLMLLADAF